MWCLRQPATVAHVTQQHQAEVEGAWLRREDRLTVVDDAGPVLLAWRVAARRTQIDVAQVLGTTQQHLSQIENGQRPVSLDLRRRVIPGDCHADDPTAPLPGRSPRFCYTSVIRRR